MNAPIVLHTRALYIICVHHVCMVITSGVYKSVYSMCARIPTLRMKGVSFSALDCSAKDLAPAAAYLFLASCSLV